MMHFFFGDDSRQEFPTRERVGPLVTAEGVLVSGTVLRSLERELEGFRNVHWIIVLIKI